MDNQVDNSTIKETLSSFYDRNKSPFVITYIITWAVYNWQLWYVTLFVSENKLKFTKLQFIYNHFNHFEVIFLPLLFSILALLIFATFNSAFDYTLLWFEIQLNKRKEKRDPDRFVIKKDFNKLLNEVQRLEKINGENSLSKIEMENKLNSKELKLLELKNTNERLLNENIDLNKTTLQNIIIISSWDMRIYESNNLMPIEELGFQITQHGFKLINRNTNSSTTFNIKFMKYKENRDVELYSESSQIIVEMLIYLKEETNSEEIKGSIRIIDLEKRLIDNEKLNKYYSRSYVMAPFKPINI